MNKSTTAENPAVEPAAMVRTLVRELSTIRDPGQALAFVLRSDESAPLRYVEAIAASGITGSQWTAQGEQLTARFAPRCRRCLAAKDSFPT
ncbi:hypothetical protein [Paraburkholderia sp. MM5477-R1]|uniref:hypothetical protein n=1 Tax=Paraburkholderia sp. MM5477-R1 TaxID=2991062 RepID=UPI003D1BCA43